MTGSDVIAVTGASGFLGSHLVKHLKQHGRHVFEISRHKGFDVCSFESLAKVPRFDTLIHLAAKTYVPDSYQDSLTFYQTNITGTLHCLELCKRNKADIIFASSYVYGKPQYLPIDESHPTALWNPYATSKIIGEHLCISYARDFGVQANILRLFNVYGAGQRSDFLIPTIIDGISRGSLILQSSWPRRDYVYVLDVVSAIERCLDVTGKGHAIYNVGTGTSYSVEQVVNKVKEILNVEVEVTYKEQYRKAEVDDVVADFSKMKAALNWRPGFNLEAGLRHILAP